MIIEILILLFIAATFLIVYLAIDSYITNKRLKENQLAWDEFSKDLSDIEKREVLLYWLEKRQIEKGWKYKYIPRL